MGSRITRQKLKSKSQLLFLFNPKDVGDRPGRTGEKNPILLYLPLWVKMSLLAILFTGAFQVYGKDAKHMSVVSDSL